MSIVSHVQDAFAHEIDSSGFGCARGSRFVPNGNGENTHTFRFDFPIIDFKASGRIELHTNCFERQSGLEWAN